MDNQFNQNDQQQRNPYQQQENPYQQGNPYQQQGNPYQQQGNPYQQQGNPYQQQGNPYQQQGNPYQQANPYRQANAYQQEKAPNIFQQFVLAFVPTKYEGLTKVKTGSMIGFVTLLVLIATLLSFIKIAVEFSSVDMEEVASALPDFAIKNGRLYMDEEFLLDDSGVFIYMTEDIDGFSYEDAANLYDEGYRNIMLVGRDRLSTMQNGEYQQLDFRDIGDSLEISRDWIVNKLAPFVLIVLAFVYIFIFVGKALWYFMAAGIYLLIGMLIAAIMSRHIETGALFRTAVYSKVLLFVVATVLDILPLGGFSIPFWIRAAATIAFMAVAIAKLPGGRLHTAPPMPMGGQGWQ